jgi:Uri superfamily endonuclease
VEAHPGTYALVLRSPSRATVRVGRLGRITLDAGYYVYVGSAFGPGGVRARVARHFRADKRRHWHIDYLRDALSPMGVWYTHDGRRLEHLWARTLEAMSDVSSIEEFGCSDCGCRSHLFFAPTKATLTALSGIDDGELSWLSYTSSGLTD